MASRDGQDAARSHDRRSSSSLLIVLTWTAVASAASASVVHSGSSERKQIALTFDDNTNVDRALATLRALQKSKVTATMFVIGSSVNAYPSINNEIVKGMAAGPVRGGRPHLLAPGADGALQLGHGRPDRRRHRRLPQGHGGSDRAALPSALRLHRLPGGRGGGQRRASRYLVLWDVDPRDWAGGSAEPSPTTSSAGPTTAPSWSCTSRRPTRRRPSPGWSRRLRDKGYELVTVSEMLKGDRLFLDVYTRARPARPSPAWSKRAS